MSMLLLTPKVPPQSVVDAEDSIVEGTPGPAALVAADAAHEDPVASGSRPCAFCTADGTWTKLGYEAADHWSQLTPPLRRRLIDDPRAELDVTEFKTATNGGSASIITSNWVYSGSPRVYRAAGQLREFVTVLAEIGA